jgi:hypothetical protein
MPRPRVDLNVFHDEIERQDEPLPPVTGKNAGEDESEDKGKRKDNGDPKGSEDLQDIREMFNEAKKPTE